MVLYSRRSMKHTSQTIERSFGGRSRKIVADANTNNESKSDISIALSIAPLSPAFVSL